MNRLVFSFFLVALAGLAQTTLIPDVIVLPRADGSAVGKITLLDVDSSNSASLRSPTAVTTSYTLTLPTAGATDGQGLTSDASGNLSWHGLMTLDTIQTVTAAKTFEATITARQIDPQAEDTYGLGSGSATWNNVSTKRVEIVGPGVSAFWYLHLTDASADTLWLRDQGGVVFQIWTTFPSNQSYMKADFMPSGDNLYDLGSTSYHWEEAYINDLILTDTFKLEAGATNGYVLTSDASGYGTWQSGGAAAHPVVDTTSIVKGSADGTKQIRFEVDVLSSGATRVLIPPDFDIILPGTNISNSWTATQIMRQIDPQTEDTYGLGSGSDTWLHVSATKHEVVELGGSSFWYFDVASGAATMRLKDNAGVLFQDWTVAGGNNASSIKGDFYPQTDSTYELGHSSYYWSHTYSDAFSTQTTLTPANWTGNILPSSTSYQLGTATYRWGQVHTDYLTVYSSSTIQNLTADGTYLTLDTSTSLRCATDGLCNIGGGSSYSMGDIYMDGTLWQGNPVPNDIIDSNANVEFNSGTFASTLSPASDAGSNLGSVALTWNSVYGVTFYGGTTSVPGLTATVSCTSGQALKGITVNGGIVSSVVCGVP